MTKQELHQSYVNYVNLTFEMSKQDERFKFEEIMSLQDFEDFGKVLEESPDQMISLINELAKEQGQDLGELIETIKPEFDKIVAQQ